jgi:AcrR family transcriptional regulator
VTDAVTLTPERILDTAEEVLRRYGPAKATVVDVARALGVSHGSVYRHFDSKAALRDAVTERWLARVSAPLQAIVASDAPAPQRLRQWMEALVAAKRSKVLDDPELFATYRAIVVDAREVVAAHVSSLIAQLETMLREGVARGELIAVDPKATAAAIFDATARFHNPAHAAEWGDPDIDAAFKRVWTLIEAGLLAQRRP